MKKLIVIFISIISFIINGNVYADENLIDSKSMLIGLGVVPESGFSSSDTISREECIISIMRILGVTDGDIESLRGSDLYVFVDARPYSYIGCAYRSRIAYGEECEVNYQTYRTSHMGGNKDFFFFPHRAVTIKEVLAFMVRCLDKDIENTFNATIEYAMKYNLIFEQDSFIQNIDSEINVDDFYILLNRMIKNKRYKYYERKNNKFQMKAYIDEDKSLTYQEMLERRL